MEARRSLRARTTEPVHPPIVLEGHLKRFIQFHKAFNFAFKTANEKWTEEDLAACYPRLYASNPEVFKQFRRETIEYGRIYVDDREREVHHQHHTGDILDDLHQAVVDATDRARANDPTALHTDTWDPTLDPPAAVRAHVVPLMKAEIERLKKRIQQLEEKNEPLVDAMKENNLAAVAADEEVKAILQNVRDVREDLSAQVRADEMIDWALEVDEKSET